MPYFEWRGVNLTGLDCKGKLFAPTYEQLDTILFKRGITLLKARPKKLLLFFYPIKRNTIIHFFEQLSLLLDTGLRLPQVLILIAQQQTNPRFQEIVYAAAQAVEKGQLLSDGLSPYPELFDPLIIQNIRVGQEAGGLGMTSKAIQVYLQKKQQFRAQLRTLLVMPCVTLLFLLAITGIIFGVMIPQFGALFSSLGQELPPLTQRMIYISGAMRTRYFFVICAILGLSGYLLYRYFRTTAGKKRKDRLVIHIPFIKSIFVQQLRIQFCYGLALLLEAGIPLSQALHLFGTAVDNQLFIQVLKEVHESIAHGSSLSEALADQTLFFPVDMVGIIAIAQEAQALPKVLKILVEEYEMKLDRTLKRLTLFMQPALMLFLGILVAILIMAIYTPIMQVGSHI